MLGRGSAGRSAATATVGVAAVTLGVFQIVEQALGDLDPRPWVRVAIVVVGGVLGLVLDRMRVLLARRQARAERDVQLDEDLAVWRLRTFDEIDPYFLGVFPVPADRSSGSLGPYVPRDLDADIEAAIAVEPFVLVFGPARSGKTRSTYEAARRALPHGWVIVPEGPAELGRLLDIDPPLDCGPDTAVVWLDGLDRFVPTLDLDLMDAAGGKDGDLRIVATIREEDYERLLEAGGQEGEVGRRVLTRARGIHLPARLSAAEEREAKASLPEHRRGAPLGADVAEILRGGHEPATRPRGQSSLEIVTNTRSATSPLWSWGPATVERLRRRIAGTREEAARRRELEERGVRAGSDVNPKRFTVDGALTLALLLLTCSGAWMGYELSQGFDQPKPPSLDEQLDDVANAFEGRGWSASRRTVFFRGENQPSYLVNYMPADSDASSEIRIYDQVGERLREAFRFRPDPAVDDEGVKVGWRFFIRNRKLDIGGSGGADAAGGFHLADHKPGRVLPVLIYRVGRKYLLKGLGRTVSGRADERPKGQRVVLEQTGSDVHVGPSYAVADFAVADLHGAVKFITGRADHPKPFAPNRVVVEAWRLGDTRHRPYLGVPCRVVPAEGTPARGEVAFVSPADVLWPEVLAAWKRVDRSASCRYAGADETATR